MKKILTCLLIIFLFSCNKSGSKLDINSTKVIAKVNGQPVYLGDIYRRIQATFGNIDRKDISPNRWAMIYETALESEIIDKLLLIEAQNENISLSNELIKEKVNKIKESMGEENYKKMLKMRKASEKDFENFVRERELIELYKNKLFSNIKIEEDKIKEYYEGHKKEFVEPEKVKLNVISVGEKEKAYEIFSRLKKHEDFDKLALEYQLQNSDKVFWKLRLMPYDAIPAEIASHIKSAKAGEILDPIEHDKKFYIIKIVEKIPSRQLDFYEVKERIKQLLLSKEQQKIIEEWYQMKLKGASIEYVTRE
jgi:parvulin-like peptidyl-prolyl isomerase